MGPSDLGGIMQKKVFLVIILALILTGCAPSGKEIILTDAAEGTSVLDEAGYLGTANESEEGSVVDDPAPSLEIHKEPENIFVYVCGAVAKPGVYELPSGSRIVDAVDVSGGFTDEADRTYVNLAARLDDGIKLFIPTVEETSKDATGKIESFDKGGSSFDEGTGKDSNGLININLATKDELTLLPGIGNSTAEKIVSYREQHGSFKSIEDIMNVSGIKDKLFSKIKDHITV
ncbi:MAG: ComEA family DNA-binding protein [Butyrivibrio sp.]|nr:ComEA family DNA-binding protein [Butyrivibrio sp.]